MALRGFSVGIRIYILLFSLILIQALKDHGTQSRFKYKKNMDGIHFTICSDNSRSNIGYLQTRTPSVQFYFINEHPKLDFHYTNRL